jgi:hypothetical protein
MLPPLGPESLNPGPGIEPVTLKIWAEPGEEGSLRFVIVIPDSQAKTTAAAIGAHLFEVTADLLAQAGVKAETSSGVLPKEMH